MFCWLTVRREILAVLECSVACCAPGNSWHFFICAPNCWFTLPLMTCEVRSRLCNGRGNLARSVQTVHSSSLSLLPSLSPSLSLPLSCCWLTSSLHPLFMQSFISTAFSWQNAKSNCHLRSEMSLSLSLSLLHSLFFSSFLPFSHLSNSFMGWLVQSLHAESSKRFRDQLTRKNGKRAGGKRVSARLKLTLSRITFYTLFPLRLVRIMNFWNRTQYVLFTIREATWYKMNIFRMKCIPITNIIQLQHYCLVPSCLCVVMRWRQRDRGRDQPFITA